MARYVARDKQSLIVQNILEWDGVSPYTAPASSEIVRSDAPAEIGKTEAQASAEAAAILTIGPRVACSIPADIETTGTVFVNAAGLALDVAANSTYKFDFIVVFRTAALTTGLGLAVTGPASPMTFAYQREIPTTTAAINALQAFTDDGSAAPTASIDVANADRMATVCGVIKTGASAGVIQLRFKSEVNASKVILRAGSGGALTKLG